MREYCEILPPPALADAVECCWISTPSEPTHRVVPDGCADILLRFRSGRPEMLAVGAMTRFEDITEQGVEKTVGVRFRPGMWVAYSAYRLTNSRTA